jgi:hypothetical protein
MLQIRLKQGSLVLVYFFKVHSVVLVISDNHYIQQIKISHKTNYSKSKLVTFASYKVYWLFHHDPFKMNLVAMVRQMQ